MISQWLTLTYLYHWRFQKVLHEDVNSSSVLKISVLVWNKFADVEIN